MAHFMRFFVLISIFGFYITKLGAIESIKKTNPTRMRAGKSQACNSPEQDAMLCRVLGGLKLGGFNMDMAANIGNFMGGISPEFVKVVLSTFDKCVFDPTSDATIAKSFKFILFKPNSDQPEYIDGIDLLNGCTALESGATLATKTLWLWPGWLSNSSTHQYFGEENNWTIDNAPKLVKRANAQVIAIDWGSTEFSACSYPMLLFCHMSTISEWMAKVIKTCSKIAPSTSIPNTWLIGHSLGAHLIGYTAKSLSKFMSKVEKLIGLDPAGPLFYGKLGTGKCHGIESEHASNTMVFLTNPGELATEHDNRGHVNVYVNRKKDFSQHGCNVKDSVCNHVYASKTLFSVLADGTDLDATNLNDKGNGETHKVTIYETMTSGIYNIESDDNPPLQKTKPHLIDEL